MATSKLEVHAGDFKVGKHHRFIDNGVFGKKLVMRKKFFADKIKMDQIESVEIASEESVKRLGGAAGWGLAGAALLGPVGLLAGLIGGGRGTDVTFVCHLVDGRKFMATAKSEVYKGLCAAVFS